MGITEHWSLGQHQGQGHWRCAFVVSATYEVSTGVIGVAFLDMSSFQVQIWSHDRGLQVKICHKPPAHVSAFAFETLESKNDQAQVRHARVLAGSRGMATCIASALSATSQRKSMREL